MPILGCLARSLVLGAVLALFLAGHALAAPARVTTPRGFDEVVARLEAAVEARGLVRIATASASRAAAARGIAIPGNAVILAFNNDFARRLLAASVPAGIEAPMRIYVTEEAAGTAVAYPLPSELLAPYGVPELGPLGRELDALFAAIVADATAP
jgi:uncharacterized protein (DUF302 family)